MLSAQIAHCNSPRHEAQIWRCLTTLVGVLPEAISIRQGCCHACLQEVWVPQECPTETRSALGSWADSIKMIGERHPEVAATILRAVDNNGSRSIEAINSCTRHLEEAGFAAPDWVQLASGEVQAPDVVDEEEPNQPRKEWQAAVSRVVERQFWDGLLPTPFEQGRHFVEITSWPSRVDSLHGVSHGSFVPDRPAASPHSAAPQVAPPTPLHCAFVRVWPYPRQLGPPSLGLLSCWGSWDEGDTLQRLLRPASAEKQVEGCGLT